MNRKKLDEIRIGLFSIIRKLGEYVFEIKTGRQSYSRKLYPISSHKLTDVLIMKLVTLVGEYTYVFLNFFSTLQDICRRTNKDECGLVSHVKYF